MPKHTRYIMELRTLCKLLDVQHEETMQLICGKLDELEAVLCGLGEKRGEDDSDCKEDDL